MASQKIRIIFENLAKTAALSASETAGTLAVTNLQNDIKTSIWRSTTKTPVITATWTSDQFINCVAIPFCNLSPTAEIQLKLYSDTAGGTLISTIAWAQAVGYVGLGGFDWGGNVLGGNAYVESSNVNVFSQGWATYARIYFATTLTKRIEIYFRDNATTAPVYVEAGTLVIGKYWSPTVNFERDPQLSIVDNSTQARSDAGNLVFVKGTKHRLISFNLNYMNDTDRGVVTRLLGETGVTKPIFFSLFPDDEDVSKEQTYQIYGCLRQLNSLSQPWQGYYNTSLDIQEI